MGKYGLDIVELEQEFQRNLEELFELAVTEPEKRQRAVAYATFYLVEVVKRWRSPGMTVQKIREGSERALDRQIRRWGSEELKNLLKEQGKEQGHEKETKEEVKAEASESTDTRDTKNHGSGEHPKYSGDQRVDPKDDPGRIQPDQGHSVKETNDPGRHGEVELGDAGPGGTSKTDSQGGTAPGKGGKERQSPPSPDKPKGPASAEGAEHMRPKNCPRCHGPMAPEMEDPLPRSSDLCPACGWNPEEPQTNPKRPRKPQTGPQPPKAGKSFSDD